MLLTYVRHPLDILLTSYHIDISCHQHAGSILLELQQNVEPFRKKERWWHTYTHRLLLSSFRLSFIIINNRLLYSFIYCALASSSFYSILFHCYSKSSALILATYSWFGLYHDCSDSAVMMYHVPLCLESRTSDPWWRCRRGMGGICNDLFLRCFFLYRN